jgi:hypothetical protein
VLTVVVAKGLVITKSFLAVMDGPLSPPQCVMERHRTFFNWRAVVVQPSISPRYQRLHLLMIVVSGQDSVHPDSKSCLGNKHAIYLSLVPGIHHVFVLTREWATLIPLTRRCGTCAAGRNGNTNGRQSYWQMDGKGLGPAT